MRSRVWITGFEPFAGAERNVSAEVARTLIELGVSSVHRDDSEPDDPARRTSLSIEWRGEVLPVDSDGARRTAGSLPTDVDLIIHLGLAVEAESIRIERVAANSFAFTIPDEGGRLAESGPIIVGSQDRITTTSPLHGLERLASAHPSIEMSDDCGGFVCNETYFRTLDAVLRSGSRDEDGHPLPVLFVHLPPAGAMAMDEMLGSVERIAASSLRERAIGVVAAVLEHRGRILCCRRSDDVPIPGMWEFPGGKVEPGESDADALVRECEEELGIAVLPIERIGSGLHSRDGRRYRIRFWRCSILSGEPRSAVHVEVRWSTPAEMMELDWLPADRPLVERLAHSSS